jgi:hypothetical protein
MDSLKSSVVSVVLFLEQSCSETWNLKRLKQYLFRCDSVMTISRKLGVFLKALPTILGCLVFLFSIILPFYYRLPITHGGPVWTYYWSFKAVARGWPGAIFGQALVFPHWFFDYWFSENVFSLGNSWIPLAMFIVQALALAFGIASIHFKRRSMLAAPVCLSVAVLALMLYTSEILPYGDYQLGYYLVFPSLALFLSAFILNEVTKKQQTKDSRSV